jgi:hypothetical protein
MSRETSLSWHIPKRKQPGQDQGCAKRARVDGSREEQDELTADGYVIDNKWQRPYLTSTGWKREAHGSSPTSLLSPQQVRSLKQHSHYRATEAMLAGKRGKALGTVVTEYTGDFLIFCNVIFGGGQERHVVYMYDSTEQNVYLVLVATAPSECLASETEDDAAVVPSLLYDTHYYLWTK